MKVTKNIEVVPYNTNWPQIFQAEAALIKKTLDDQCLEIHHIGSTAVPGLCAKPKIDIIAVVKNGDFSIEPLEKLDFIYKGEWNIPFQFGFTKRCEYKINLHVFKENHPEIKLNILFRDHLRTHPESVCHYTKIKEALLTKASSFLKQEDHLFYGYSLGKDDFIRNILVQEGYADHRFLKVTHYKEWDSVHRIRKEQIFDPIHIIYDPNHPTISAANNHHFILCKGIEAVTVAHVEFLNETTVALRSLATDSKFQFQGYGKEMMQRLEKWLKYKKIKLLKMHSRLSAEGFYRKLGYQNCHFDDPCIQEQYTDLAKAL